MHSVVSLSRNLSEFLPQTIHQRRLQALELAVNSVMRGSTLSITQMGRYLRSGTRVKHQVKRMDRLVANGHLARESSALYRAMVHRLLGRASDVLVLVDWSDFSVDGQQQLLRASVPVGGRALTLYEELHPKCRQGHRAVHQAFLEHLATILPARCVPVIVADAGFKTPFYRSVESLGWHWLGRIRGLDQVCWDGAPHQWVGAKSLYAIATTRAADLGLAQWTRKNPLAGRLVLIFNRRRGRHDHTLKGQPRRSAPSRKQARRHAEPWLLVASPSLHPRHAKTLVNWYRTRMQIEEGFRDTKSVSRGLGIARGRHTSFKRAHNLLLIAALATFSLWILGHWAKQHRWQRHIAVNNRDDAYSNLTLARLLIAHGHTPTPRRALKIPSTCVPKYMASLEAPS